MYAHRCVYDISAFPILHLSVLLFFFEHEMNFPRSQFFSLAIPNAIKMLERISRPIIYMTYNLQHSKSMSALQQSLGANTWLH